MQYFQKLFTSSQTKFSAEACDVATASLPSPFETTAICATPHQARRVIKTVEGKQLVLCADDVKYLSVIENMFADLKALNNDVAEEAFVVIPISIDAVTMLKIIDWSRAAKKVNENTLNFCQFFPDISVKECLQILEASLFLETTSLGKSAGKWLAAKLEGKSTGEMARILNVPYEGLCAKKREQLARFSLVTHGRLPAYLD